MSRPPETSLTSRELVEQIITQLRTAANPDEISTMTALIDAWVLVREAQIAALVEKWRKDLPTEPFSMRPTDHIYTICADQLEAALATARKQREEKKGESA